MGFLGYLEHSGPVSSPPLVKDIGDAAEAAFGYVLEHNEWWRTPLGKLRRLATLCGGGAGSPTGHLKPAALIKTLSVMFATGSFESLTQFDATHAPDRSLTKRSVFA
jgi:hypothetical protein